MLRWNGELRLAANLGWLFTESPLMERVLRAKEAGFGGLEIGMPYAYPAAELASRVREAELEVVLINTPAGSQGSPTAWGAACLPQAVDEFRSGIEKALTYAVELEAEFIHVMGGQRPLGLSHESAYATYLDNIAWAGVQATSAGVTLLLETINQIDVPRFVLRSIDDATAAVSAVASPRVQALLDVYHCQMNDDPCVPGIDELLPYIGHIQVADAPGRHEPGTGEIPWQLLFTELRASDYLGWIGCEYRPTHATADGLGWAKAVGAAAQAG